MNTYEIIKKKRDGHPLDPEEIRYLIAGFTSGTIPDYQLSAFLMAVYFQGMNSAECVALTRAMADSGDTVDLSPIEGFKVDKHSTGGVGDTTTLVLAPLVAACGGIVAKMSGRELGHTGGTIDKLESIPGLRTALSENEFRSVANRIGVSILSQTARLAPADKRIYALRNVTATVDSIPLIAGSIMSKKLAAGADGIVLDVKTGSGAFMEKYEDALALARTMVKIGSGAGKKVAALITSMEQPLGYAVGNAVEMREAIDTLNGWGPVDLTELVLALGSDMLHLSGIGSSLAEARGRLEDNLANGRGLAKLSELIEAQGGDADIIHHPGKLPQPREIIEIKSPSSGYVQSIDALNVGLASKVLGAGRQTKEQAVDPAIGILLNKKVGDLVGAGEALARLYSDGNGKKIAAAEEKMIRAYTIGRKPVEPPPLLLTRVSADGVEPLKPKGKSHASPAG